MSSKRIRSSEPCQQPFCGQHTFYVSEDGYMYCLQGHQQTAQGVAIAQDDEDIILTGQTHRRDSQARSISTTSTIKGPTAVERLVLCLQLVLRKQVWWLVHQQGLPAELETIVKELWTLQLEDIDLSAVVEDDTDESSGFNSQSDSSQTSRRVELRVLSMIELLAILYTAMTIIRAPVTVGDIYRWISDGELLYYQSSTCVPRELREYMPFRLQERLDPEVMKPSHLHRTIRRKLKFYEGHGLQLPEINTTVILYRWIEALALPLEVYVCTKRLTQLCSQISFSAKSQMYRSPEVLLMTLLIVAVKMLFPFEETGIKPQSPEDLAVLRLDWKDWLTKPKKSIFERSLTATAEDCLRMEEEDLDQYLDWYQQYMASEEISHATKQASFRHAMKSKFPVDRPRADVMDSELPVASDQLRRMSQHLTFPYFLWQQDHRVEESYSQFHDLDELRKEGNEVPARLYELAAKLCAVELDKFIKVVVSVEKKVLRYKKPADSSE